MASACAVERRVAGAAGKQRKPMQQQQQQQEFRRISGRSFANSCKTAQAAAQLDERVERDGASPAKETAARPQKRVTHLCNEASTGM